MFFFLAAFDAFWRKHPALALGLTFYLSALFAFGYFLGLVYFFLFFSLFFRNNRLWALLFLGIFLTFGAWVFLWHRLPSHPTQGTAYLSINSFRKKTRLFGRTGCEMRGVIKKFVSEEGKCASLHAPFVSHLPTKWGRPKASYFYEVPGTIFLQKNHKLRLKPTHPKEWTPKEKSLKLCELRFHAKEKLKRRIKTKIKDEKAGIFLSALITGELDDTVMRKTFQTLGLSHILAISGFHFSLLAFFLYLFFKCFLGPKSCRYILLFFLTAYLLFIGKSASIERAYVMAVSFLISGLVARRYTPLNSLGCALSILLLKDPFALFEMGFQFSFLATAGILLLFQPIHFFLQYLLPKRELENILSFSFFQKHVLLVLALFRKSFAFLCAVYLTVLPLSLFYFGHFSFLGLVINLFFPFFVSLSLFLLFLGLCTPYLGDLFHAFNTVYTKALLNFTEFPPLILNKTLWFRGLSLSFVACYLFCLLLGGICLKMYLEKKRIYGALLWF